MIARALSRVALASVALARVAAAGVTGGAPEPPAPAPPLAELKDDKQVAELLQAITSDPAVAVDDPATRPLAQALMTEGVRQLKARAYDQALANFLEAYARFPSPRILLNVGSTLRDMGRLADAANTYQRYLTDPATSAERVGEVKALLLKLDEQLTILTVRVFPRGSEISIDGGPFIPVGSTLLTRVRTGLHLVRIRKDGQAGELTVNGFEGENKEVAPAIQLAVPAEPSPASKPPVVAALATPTPPTPSAAARPPVVAPPAAARPPAPPPDRVDGWLITGTGYATGDATGGGRTLRADSGDRDIAAIFPPEAPTDTGARGPDRDDEITSGAIGVVRIDGKGRGFAGGAGLALSRDAAEVELMLLKSDEVGGYLGFRYRLLTGVFRPYVALGAPGFLYDHSEVQPDRSIKLSKRLGVGVRVAAGLELKINGHLSVQGDLGYEHFFSVDDRFETDVFVPTLGVIGRL